MRAEEAAVFVSRYRAVNIKHIFDHASRHLSVRQFPEQHLFVRQNERHGQVDSTPPCAHEHA